MSEWFKKKKKIIKSYIRSTLINNGLTKLLIQSNLLEKIEEQRQKEERSNGFI